MRMESLKIRGTPFCAQSAVVVDKSLVICLAGKPSGAVEV